MKRPFLILFFYFGFWSISAQGQNRPSITGEFKDIKVGHFARLLESFSGYHFFYDSLQVDSIVINLTVTGEPLDIVLEKAFTNTSIKFSIDQHNNVFLIKDRIIKTDLPSGFFGITKA